VSTGTRQTLWVERETTAEGDSLRVGGDVPIGGEQRVYRAMSDSARGVGLLLAETLREVGITASGPIVVTEEPPPANALVLAKTEGLTVNEQLGRMLRFSNNYIADVLTMDLAASIMGRPPADLASAAQVLTQFMTRVLRAAQPSERSHDRESNISQRPYYPSRLSVSQHGPFSRILRRTHGTARCTVRVYATRE
jgi:D-alanyl-D-alanine carboxypeptidase/D-alanyl-D-alanine-endopeptidase (penicillin-binding protein 4)